jgi:hypothetical protein
MRNAIERLLSSVGDAHSVSGASAARFSGPSSPALFSPHLSTVVPNRRSSGSSSTKADPTPHHSDEAEDEDQNGSGDAGANSSAGVAPPDGVSEGRGADISEVMYAVGVGLLVIAVFLGFLAAPFGIAVAIIGLVLLVIAFRAGHRVTEKTREH